LKVLFTHSYFLRFDPKQFETAQPYPPLGTLYAMSYLRENGYEVKLHDAMFCSSAEDIIPVLQEFKPDVLISYDDGFNYLTKMCLTNMREACFKMQQLAKQNGCYVITSSSDAADHFEKYLEQGANVIAIGEGEQTILEVCNALKNKNPIENIHGLAFKKNNAIVKTQKRTVLKDLDQLPFPAWDLLNISPYKSMWMDRHGYFSLNFVTTRGCPYKCNWCAKPIYGNRYNSHSAQPIVTQIKILQEKFGFTHVWFADDIFGLKPGWLKHFAEQVKTQELKIRYKIQSRADLLVEEDTVKYLAESGGDTVWMGAESGSQKILDAMEKGTTVKQIKQARALLKQHHVKTAFFLQFGYIGETMDDIRQTIDLVKDTMPDEIGISVSYPLPGTGFHEKVKNDLGQKTNWIDSNEMKLMFKNTYSADFYKVLYRLVHSIYRKRKASDKLRKNKDPRVFLSYMKNSLAVPVQSFQLKQKMKSW
jgi:anaerobic magnesium-protoporphyrin IX monomethyl ester cyclase